MDVEIRPMTEVDLEAVSRIYALHTGEPPPGDWRQRVGPLLESAQPGAAALVAEADDGGGGQRIVGYLVGEVRSWEFGSEPVGWIFGLGVEPEVRRQRVANRLMSSALRRLSRAGVRTVRTMVRRDDLAVLTFFRSSGFIAGPYSELELTLEESEP